MRSQVTRKTIFTVPFYRAYGAQLLCLHGCYTGGYKVGVVTPAQPTSSHMIFHYSSASLCTTEKKDENRETDLKNKRELLSLPGVISLYLLFHVELS
jgi:hypothetical protein